MSKAAAIATNHVGADAFLRLRSGPRPSRAKLGKPLARNRRWLRLSVEDKSITEQKIRQRTDNDRNKIRRDIVELHFAHQQPHQPKVPDHRNRSIAGVELNQPE